jgi:glycosyltransferase involved in cell wall biosynthesis
LQSRELNAAIKLLTRFAGGNQHRVLMRVLFPTSEFPPQLGGVATLAYQQARGLARLQNDVTVVTQINIDDLPQQEFRLVRVANAQRSILRVLPLARAVARLSGENDVIYSPTYRAFGPACLYAMYTRQIPYVIYLHGSEINTEQKSILRKYMMGRVLKSASMLIANTAYTRELCLSCYLVDPSKIAVLHPGVDLLRFANSDCLEKASKIRDAWLKQIGASANDAVVIISISRINRSKGLGFVLRALARLLEKNPKLKLYYVMAGEGPDLDLFKSEVYQLGISQHVLFAGKIPQVEIEASYFAADVYAQPSQPVGDFVEGFGISFVEAQAAGLPCIGSDWGGVPEAVAKDVSGYLLKPGDLEGIERAMLKLASSKELRENMGNAGRENAARFSWTSHAQQLAAILKKAAREPGKR